MLSLLRVFLVLAVIVIVASNAFAEDISLEKIHVVEHFPNSRSFLFRGNAPLTGSKENVTFAYDKLYKYMATKAQTEANATLPPASKTYIVDITFENIFDKGYNVEYEFWANPANAQKGKYLEWLLVGDLIWPAWVSPTERNKMIENGTIWVIDKIPQRLRQVRQMLRDGPPQGYDALAIYCHCAGGCDRTGEFITSYEMAFHYRPTLLEQYKRDCSSAYGCGRCPDFWTTGGIAWYCLAFNLFNSSTSRPPLPDCLTAYECKLFGGCEPGKS